MAKKQSISRQVRHQFGPFAWSKTTLEILRHTSALTLLLRDANIDDLRDVERRLKHFYDAWVVSGEGDALPASAKNSDVDGCLADVDVTECVRDVVLNKIG